MNISKKQQEKLNNFKREYLDIMQPIHWGYCKYDNKNSEEHNDTQWEIIKFFTKKGLASATEVKFKTGYQPDVICPEHPFPIIEVRHSETEKKTQMKQERIPEELRDKIVYVESGTEITEEVLL